MNSSFFVKKRSALLVNNHGLPANDRIFSTTVASTFKFKVLTPQCRERERICPCRGKLEEQFPMSTRASRSLLSHKHLIPWNYSHLGKPREGNVYCSRSIPVAYHQPYSISYVSFQHHLSDRPRSHTFPCALAEYMLSAP